MIPSPEFAKRVRRLLNTIPAPPTTTAKILTPRGRHVATLVLNGKTGTRRRMRVTKRRRS